MSTADADIETLRGILQPYAHEIAEARVATNGIVFVVHQPGPLARQAVAKLNGPAGDPVFARTCREAQHFCAKMDRATVDWLGVPPVEGQIKILLIAGDGTALLTLNFVNGEVLVNVESQTAGLN